MSPLQKDQLEDEIVQTCEILGRSKQDVQSITVDWVELASGAVRPKITLTFK